MNSVTLCGNVVNSPDVKTTVSGVTVATFRVATNETYRDKQGKTQTKAEFHRIVVFGATATACGKYLSKGRQCLITGKLQTNSYTDKDNVKRYSTEVVAANVQFLGVAPKADGSAPDALPQASEAEDDIDY